MMHKPIIGITMGDAAGIGPEIILKTLEQEELYELCQPIVIGDAGVMENGRSIGNYRSHLTIVPLNDVSEAKFEFGKIDVLDLGNVSHDRIQMGVPQAEAGKASYEYVREAVRLAQENKLDAIATAPLSKEAMNMAGIDFPGHTEILASLTGTEDYAMMFIAGEYRVILVTIHTSLKDACEEVSTEKVLASIRLADATLRRLDIKKPRVAVAGLNPHAGESGMFGREDIDVITPAVKEAKRDGIDCSGPYPADTLFFRAWRKGEFDIIVAMYHDQGCIPLKLMGFDIGVNMTVGLPIIRTSVDHGTAYGRAGKKLGTGDPTSLVEAVKIAAKLSGDKHE